MMIEKEEKVWNAQYIKVRVCKYNCVKATFFINITSDG